MQQSEYIEIDKKILSALPVRKKRSNKGIYGKVLCIAGSKNMAGAAYLCAHAAYRTGAGLVRVFTPEENRVIIQTLIPEAVLTTFDCQKPDMEKFQEALDWADVVAIGPGIGRENWAESFVEYVLKKYHKPLVVDADGLNHLSAHMHWLDAHDGPIIITPHVGEFSRLSGRPIQDILDHIPVCAKSFAEEHGCICVLKDAPSAVGTPDGRVWVNTTGNNGMSTGGSGDVLTGMIAGLLAQKTELLQAALLGVWLHGRSGDLAAVKESVYGLLARHLIEYLPEAMREMEIEEKGAI